MKSVLVLISSLGLFALACGGGSEGARRSRASEGNAGDGSSRGGGASTPLDTNPYGGAAPACASEHSGESCSSSAQIALDQYWVSNNLWGADEGMGSQCIWSACGDDGSLGWGTSYEWSGGRNSVKSYAAAILGWHWGWERTDTGLPIALVDGSSVTCDWSLHVHQEGPVTQNVAYDLWLHDVPSPTWENQPTNEVMVWLYRSGGAGPVGSKVADLQVAGTDWELHEGVIPGESGWKVHSFIRKTNTESASVNLSELLATLIERGSLEDTKYLSSVQAGTEVFTGKGQVDTYAYSCAIE